MSRYTSKAKIGSMVAMAAMSGPHAFLDYGPLLREPQRPKGSRGNYDTNALRDDEQRLKDAQERRERKRAKRLAQRRPA